MIENYEDMDMRGRRGLLPIKGPKAIRVCIFRAVARATPPHQSACLATVNQGRTIDNGECLLYVVVIARILGSLAACGQAPRVLVGGLIGEQCERSAEILCV